MKRFPLALILTVMMVLGIFFFGCEKKKTALKMVIVHSADVRGELEPCG